MTGLFEGLLNPALGQNGTHFFQGRRGGLDLQGKCLEGLLFMRVLPSPLCPRATQAMIEQLANGRRAKPQRCPQLEPLTGLKVAVVVVLAATRLCGSQQLFCARVSHDGQ